MTTFFLQTLHVLKGRQQIHLVSGSLFLEEVTYPGSSHLFARLLRDDAVVDGQVHVADFENALKLAHRLDNGRGIVSARNVSENELELAFCL